MVGQNKYGFKRNPTQSDDVVNMPLSKKIIIGVITILIVIAFLVAGNIVKAVTEKPEERKRSFNTLAVMADKARVEDIKLSVNVQGEARPQTEIDLVPEVGGKIVYVSPNFIEGGIFKKGETLLRIEDADYKVAVIRAEAAVAQAEQALVREQAEGELARRDYEELGTGTPSPLALREPQQAQARASLEAARAELDGAKLQLTRTAVRAPFSGRVRTKTSDLGQFISPGSRLGRVFSTEITEVRLALTDNDLSKLNLPVAYVAKSRAEALPVEFSASLAGQVRTWSGHIMRTDSVYDTQTRALFAIAEVVDPYGKGAAEGGFPLSPGLYVDARIEGKTFENVIIFPRDGLRPDDEVYVVDDKGKAEIRQVSVLDTNADRAVLLSGVAANELVVLSPMEKSRITMTLKVLDVNNPKTVLVDPPKPEWMIQLEESQKLSEEEKKKKKEEGKLDRKEQQELTAIYGRDFKAVKAEMTDEEKEQYRKWSDRERSQFIRKKMAERAKANRRGPRPGEGETESEDATANTVNTAGE